jgi:hypothetical protein
VLAIAGTRIFFEKKLTLRRPGGSIRTCEGVIPNIQFRQGDGFVLLPQYVFAQSRPVGFFITGRCDVNDLFSVDVCERKHGGSDTSAEAYRKHSGIWPNDRMNILEFIRQDELGTTLADVAVMMGKEKNQVSGRISELKRMGFIIDTGRRRNGFAVYRAVSHG